jgi:hypothetical protein
MTHILDIGTSINRGGVKLILYGNYYEEYLF